MRKGFLRLLSATVMGLFVLTVAGGFALCVSNPCYAAAKKAAKKTAKSGAKTIQKSGGGYGPRVKGLQLGTKMSLNDMLSWGSKNLSFPLTFNVNAGGNNQLTLDIAGKNGNATSFSFRETQGTFSRYRGKRMTLSTLFAVLEKEGFKMARLGDSKFYHVNIDGNLRVSKLYFTKTDFGVAPLTEDRQFIQQFINAYNIPRMDVDNTLTGYQGTRYFYQNFQQGWMVECRGTNGALGLLSNGLNTGITIMPIDGSTRGFN